MFDPYELARSIACPVAFLTSTDGKTGNIMISTVAYASLKPLILSTSINAQSRTGQLAISTGRIGISMAVWEQLELVEQVTTCSEPDKFAACGVEPHFFASGTLYVDGGIAAFDATVDGAFAGGTQTLLLLRVHDALSLSAGRPLLRYNRTYCTVDQSAPVKDDYPV